MLTVKYVSLYKICIAAITSLIFNIDGIDGIGIDIIGVDVDVNDFFHTALSIIQTSKRHLPTAK